MNCEECGATQCACAAEDAVYAAYARSIDVPPLWDGVVRRIERERARRWWLAAVAAVILIAIFVIRKPEPTGAMADAREHYQRAIETLEPHASSTPFVAELNAAIEDANRAAARAPDDPMAVTRLVAAYDAKVRLLREARR